MGVDSSMLNKWLNKWLYSRRRLLRKYGQVLYHCFLAFRSPEERKAFLKEVRLCQ